MSRVLCDLTLSIKVGVAHKSTLAALGHDFSCIFLILITNIQKVAPCRNNINHNKWAVNWLSNNRSIGYC